MKYSGIVLLFVVFLSACNRNNTTVDSNKAAFITYLGNDTLAVEQFVKTENGITANVILRSPASRFSTYELILDETGGIETLTRTDFPLDEGFDGTGTVAQTIERQGDSLMVQVVTPEDTRRYSAPYKPGVLPFIDMVHWPFELAFNHAAAAGQDTVNQLLLTGRRLSNFIIAGLRADSMTIRHPSRGVMGVRVDEKGNLLFLDAGLTTRKLKVYRVASVDINAIGENFAVNDQNGNPFGQLSIAEETEFSFKGVNFRVEYGSPQKRGRELFGNIVPWGERWRTGANRATHFFTSTDLKIGDLEVPAGEYTLFTIPEADGGTLIINKQTGQNGRTYDEARDLGRVPMQLSKKDDVTEAFTITVEETESGGKLNLIWGQTVFSVDFVIP